VAVTLLYQMFTKPLGWMLLRARSDTVQAIEMLVLRPHWLVLQRRMPRPTMSWTDRTPTSTLS